MKRFTLFFVVLILAATVAFAQDEQQQQQPAQQEQKEREIEFFNFELNIGFPVHWSNSSTPHDFYNENDIDRTVTANTAFGIGLNFNFTKKIGLVIEADIFYGASVMGDSAPNSSSNSMFGLNAFIGPVFYLVNNGNLRIPFSVGAHAYIFLNDFWFSNYHDDGAGTVLMGGGWIKTFDMQFGPAFNLGVQFHFNDGIYLFSNTTVAIDLYRIHELTYNDTTDIVEKSHSGDFDVAWMIKPSFGLGLKF